MITIGSLVISLHSGFHYVFVLSSKSHFIRIGFYKAITCFHFMFWIQLRYMLKICVVWLLMLWCFWNLTDQNKRKRHLLLTQTTKENLEQKKKPNGITYWIIEQFHHYTFAFRLGVFWKWHWTIAFVFDLIRPKEQDMEVWPNLA